MEIPGLTDKTVLVLILTTMSSVPVTMKHVAERAGVSLMTVSRVLRNHPHVSPACRKKVERAVRETGYRANPLVGAWMAHLRTSKARGGLRQTIAFITNDSERHGWKRSLTVRSYFEGADDRANRLGFTLEHFWLGEPGMTPTRMSGILRARGINGILIAPLPLPVISVGLDWASFAPVVFGYSMREPQLHRVTNHQIHTMRLAIRKLTESGHRRIGLALELAKDARVDHNWTTGLYPHLNEIRKSDRVPPFLPNQLAESGLVGWYEKHRPDAILGGRQDMVQWLRRAGHRVPEDVGFATLEYYSEYGDLAGVDQNSHIIGAAAVDLVIEQLYHNERGIPEKPKVVMIEGEWRNGGTLLDKTAAPSNETGSTGNRKK